MNQKFLQKIQESSLVRLSILFGGLLVLSMAITLFSKLSLPPPEITSINPKIGIAGDVIVISGRNFGKSQNDGYVEIGGLRLVQSSFLKWDDTEIMAVLPSNVSSGKVYVVTKDRISNPKIWTNRFFLPKEVKIDIQTSVPSLSEVIVEDEAAIGQIITLVGKNFGEERMTSNVVFTKHGELPPVMALEENYDYDLWSDEKIRVRIPNGAESGSVFVETKLSRSNALPITLAQVPGTKTFSNMRTYVVEIKNEISDPLSSADSSILLRFPIPISAPFQKVTEITTDGITPLYKNLDGTMVIQRTVDFRDEEQPKTQQTSIKYVISNYHTRCTINQDQVEKYSSKTRSLYEKFLQPDDLIPSDSKEIIAEAKKIAGNERNPYAVAKTVYNYFIDSFIIKSQKDSDKMDFDEVLAQKSGDAYEATLLFIAYLRSLGIIALPVSGLIVNNDLTTEPHWWCELYIENYGWLPADLLCSVKSGEKFGVLENNHIAFSFGINEFLPLTANSTLVRKSKTFAIQSFWEEASETMLKYTSYWFPPKVEGIY